MKGLHYIADDLVELKDGEAWLCGAVDRGVAAAEQLLAKHAGFHAFLDETGQS